MSSILFVSQALPFPPDSGATQRTLHVLTELQREFDVHLVAFSRRGHQPDAEARARAEDELRQRLSSVSPSTPYPSEWSPLRRAWDHGRSLLTEKPYSHFQYGVPEFGRRLEEAVEEVRPDLVHLDSIDLVRWMDRLPPVPITCTHHDIESHVLRRRARSTRNPLSARYIELQAARARGLEAGYCPHFALNLTMSHVDSERLREIAPGSRVMEAPNAVDLERFPLPAASDENPETVVFMGPTYLFANADALRFLLEQIWPRVRAARPAARLVLVGRNAPGEAAELGRLQGVVPRGRVESIQPHLGSAACSVVPIRVGGGTRIKILESWALGRPVVTTSLGAEGLQVTDGENALVRDDPDEFAEAVLQVLEDADLRRSLGRAGRSTVERCYTWSAVGERVRRAYAALVEEPVTPGVGRVRRPARR